MAEIVSTATSSAGIFVLAAQLGDSIKKLKEFQDLYKDVPDALRSTIDDIELLKLVLDDIVESFATHQYASSRIRNIINKTIDLCERGTNGLCMAVKDLENGIQAGKKRGSIRITFRNTKIQELRDRLERAKMRLMLANQCYFELFHCQESMARSQDMIRIKAVLQSVSAKQKILSTSLDTQTTTGSQQNFNGYKPRTLKLQSLPTQKPSKLRISTTHGLLGVLSYRSIARHQTVDDGDQKSHCTEVTDEIMFDLQIPTWFFARRFYIGYRRSTRGWNYQVRSFNVVPYNAPIIKLCATGNIDEIRKLFELGKASAFDIDPEGRTLLHYSAVHMEPEVCKLLIASGLDSNAITHTRRYHRHLEIEGEYRLPMSMNNSYPDDTPAQSLASTTLFHYQQDIAAFESTMRVLVEDGDCNLLATNSRDQNIFHLYRGPVSFMRWLEGHSPIPVVDFERSFPNSMNKLMRIAFLGWANTYALLRALLPNNYPDHRIAGFHTQTGDTLFHTITRTWACLLADIPKSCYAIERISYATDLESILRDLLACGSDPNLVKYITVNSAHGLTPFLSIIGCIIRQTPKKSIQAILVSWLRIIHRSGISLPDFGMRERQLLQTGQVSWVFHGPYEIELEIAHVEFGQNPEDFCIVWEDDYVTKDLLPGFWKLVECAKPIMPGSRGVW